MSLFIGLGFAGMFLQDGVRIDKFDENNQIMYISIPEDSYAYHNENSDSITDAESYAKRNKEILAEIMHMPDLQLRFKTYPGYWTKEMGNKNFNEHIREYI